MAADYGAPTTRKRFVLVARCDGRPIAWPERTHNKDGADGLPKWRAAAEVIDWSQPCYSIFATKEEIKSRYGVTAVRPLADNTMRRVIRGVDKFVIRAKTPYIVPWTVTNTCNSVGSQVTAPVHTVTTAGNQILLSPALIQYHTEQSENVRGQSVAETLRTVDASNRYGLIAANLVEYYGKGVFRYEQRKGTDVFTPEMEGPAQNRKDAKGEEKQIGDSTYTPGGLYNGNAGNQARADRPEGY